MLQPVQQLQLVLLQPPVQFWQHSQLHVLDHMQLLPDDLSPPVPCEQHLFEPLAAFETVQLPVTDVHPLLSQQQILCFEDVSSHFVSAVPPTGQSSADDPAVLWPALLPCHIACAVHVFVLAPSSWYPPNAVHLSASVLSSFHLACVVHLPASALFSLYLACAVHLFPSAPSSFHLACVVHLLASVHASLHHLSLPVPFSFHSLSAVHLSSFCPVPSTVPFFGHAVVAPQPVQMQPFWPHSFCAECSAQQFSADALDALWPDGRSLEVAQR